MGRIVQEFRSNEVLADAIYSGLSALVRLSYKRKNDLTHDFYEQIKRNWEHARTEWKSSREQGSHDFSSIQSRESILRRLYLQMLWHSTARYGNKEFKRVYSWREGTIGPLNELLNYMGSLLRDVLVPRYYFPDPDVYQVRRYRDGRVEILPKSIAETIPPERGAKTHQKAGYRGNSKKPRVLLAHPTLPALDFADMIRAHLIELCRQCFIHAVPRRESHRFIRLLIHRLIPFLDWIYTRGKSGWKNFSPDADRELRKIVLEIRTHFSNRSGTSEGISRQIESPPVDSDVDSLKERVKMIIKSTEEEHIREKGEVVLGHIKKGIIRDEEVSKFLEEVTRKAQREGNDWHRVLLSGFCHPRSLREAVFAGDQFLQTPAGMQYLAEVPVVGNHAAGRIDLVLFVRILRGAGQYIWIPVMILEVKTKEGFSFNIYGMRPRTRKRNVYVPVLESWKVPLTESEWQADLGSKPPKSHLDQLDEYERMILTEFNALVNDPLASKHVWKGVVTLDISQDYEITKRAFDQLIDQLATKLLKGELWGQWKTLKFESTGPDEPLPRIAITMTPAQGPVHLLRSIVPAKTVQDENPFTERVEDDLFFTQYISVPSPTSSGKSAAWLAKNWHLLNHLAELADTAASSPFLLWIDLLSDYSTEKMANMRFGLDALRRRGPINQSEFVRLSGFLKRVRFVNLRKEIDDLILAGSSSGLKDFHARIRSVLLKESGERLIVVDGWSDLESMVPAHRRNSLRVLELSLLQVLKELASEVIWVDSGVNHPELNETYGRPCVSSLRHDSPRRQLVDEIIWNLPTAPREMGWLSPQYDENRVIIQDLPIDNPPWTAVIRVPPLRGWTRKFSAAAKRSPSDEANEYVGVLNQQQDMYGRSFHGASIQVRYDMVCRETLDVLKERAFSLIPSLFRPRQGQAEETKKPEFEVRPVAYHSVDGNRTQSGLTSRLHLDLMQPPPHPNRFGKHHQGIHVEVNQISRRWIHKEYDELDEQPITITRIPPLNYLAESSLLDTTDIRRREIQRLQYAATFLRDRTSLHGAFFSLYQEIIHLCEWDGRQSSDDATLLYILTQVKDALVRRTEPRVLWALLSHARSSLGDLLNSDNQSSLRLAQRHNIELLELYGMNLFLAVLSVADRVFKDVESPFCIDLWSAVARWQLYQMGYRPEDDGDFEYRYDFRAIHSNLLWRAKQMKKASQDRTRFPERFGQLLWQEGSEGGNIWLLFPSSKSTIYGGLMEGQMSAYLPFGWYRCVIDPQQAKTEAIAALSRKGWEELPIVIVEVNRQQVLYIKSDGEDGKKWAFAGAFEYGHPPKEKNMPVRWIRLSEPLPETLLALHGYRPISPSSHVRAQCDAALRKAVAWSGVIREVSCLLTINLEKKVYRINLLEGSKTIAKKETPYTDEVIRFLRYPQRTGEYFATRDGTYLKWDSLKDVEYDEVMVKNKEGKREYYHLSMFKPFIHRSTFFSDSLVLPSTCEELLGTSERGDIILRIDLDKQKKDRGFKKYMKVHLDGLKENGRVSGLESEEMGFFDVALLAECGQLVDVDTHSRYTLAIDAKALVSLGLVNLLSDYSKLENAIIGHIDDLESTEPDETHLDREVEDDDLEEGPELRFVRADVEESVRRRMLSVIVHLCNTDDEDDFEELTVFSVSSEIAKTGPISYDYIEQEVKINLKGRRISGDTRDEILKGIEEALEREGVKVDYY
ncbi:MAG: hypothetical protein C4K48_03705 [Candidatus Thorarchaeota archaeon]|nr:MAG: hypothetical protein C4K48_03705 [Candidatus Thorarchaeota archaeon]